MTYNQLIKEIVRMPEVERNREARFIKDDCRNVYRAYNVRVIENRIYYEKKKSETPCRWKTWEFLIEEVGP